MAKKWEPTGRTDHDFARPRTSGRDDVKTKSRSNNINYSSEEGDYESDSESEDEEDLSRKSGKLKQKTGKAGIFKNPRLSQKSGNTKSLRPSKYLFRDRGGWNEEKQWEGREIPEDSKGKAGWYARQLSRLTYEDKVRCYFWPRKIIFFWCSSVNHIIKIEGLGA